MNASANPHALQNYAAQHARWAWEGERKILASFWDQPGMYGEPIMYCEPVTTVEV